MHNPWTYNENSNDQKSIIHLLSDFILGRNKLNFNVPKIRLTLLILSVVLFLSWLMTGFFSINANENGIILRFGKYDRKVGPGLNYKLPYPIETVEKVDVTRIKRDVLGKIPNVSTFSRYNNDSVQNPKDIDISYTKESQMLTGDENIIDMHFFVQWRIIDAKQYLFNIKDVVSDSIIRTVSESIMRQVIGGVSISEALSERRLVIETQAKNILQSTLDSYKSGIEIVGVGILYSYVGPEVRDSYRDVQSAKADREKFINQAQAYRNEILPKAKGEAISLIEQALAIKNSNIARAKGESQKFDKIYKSYTFSKEITNKRMYLDTIQSVYKDSIKVIIDASISKNMLPLLDLGHNRIE